MPTPAIRRSRRLVLGVLAGAALAAGALAAAAAPPSAGSATLVPAAGAPEHDVRHLPPVPGELWRPYEPPGTTYGPGHRGVDLGAAPGDRVRASAAGVVVHAGPVAGATWVSIDHVDGLRTAYGPLTALQVTAGHRVEASEVLGTLAAGGHGHDGHDRGLHFSVRRDGIYLDPLALLGGDRVPSLHGSGSTAPLSGPPGAVADAPRSPELGVATPGDRLAVPGPPVPAAPTRYGRRWTP